MRWKLLMMMKGSSAGCSALVLAASAIAMDRGSLMRHVALKVRVESWEGRIRLLLKMLGMMVRGIHHVVEIVSTVGGRVMTAGVLVAIVIEHWGTA